MINMIFYVSILSFLLLFTGCSDIINKTNDAAVLVNSNEINSTNKTGSLSSNMNKSEKISQIVISNNLSENSNKENFENKITLLKSKMEELKPYDYIYPINQNGKYGYISENGQIVIEPKFEEAHVLKEDRAVVKLNGKYGVINKKGEFIVEPKFNFCDDYSEGFAVFQGNNNKYGYIDKDGNGVIEPKYYGAGDFSEGMAVVKYNYDEEIYIDSNGIQVIDSKYVYANPFSDGMANVIFSTMPDFYGYINKKGEAVMIFEKDHEDTSIFGCTAFVDGIAFKVTRDENEDLKWILIDKNGDRVGKLYFDFVIDFSEGIASVKVGDKWGTIGKDGEFIIQPQFDYIDIYSDGLARFDKNDKSGYIDKSGKVIIEPEFDIAMPFYRGLANVEKEDKWMYIDKKGNIIWESEDS